MQKYENNYILPIAKKLKMINMLGGKCKMCNESRFYVLEFHHKDPIEKDPNWNFEQKESEIIDEIKKCELLCSNCHREYHYLNNSMNDTRSRTNKNILLEYVQKDKCEKCGYNKCFASLSFHHNDKTTKSFSIGNINLRLKSVHEISNEIIEELNKCILLCENCHKDEHFDYEKYKKYEQEIAKRSQTHHQYKKYNAKEIIELFLQKKSYAEITKQTGASKGSISYILHSHGIK